MAHTKYFADAKHGGKERALQVAIEYRDRAMRAISSGRMDLPAAQTRPNTSGFVGVTRGRTLYKDGRAYCYWVAEWIPAPGMRPKRRKFSVDRYGEAEAKALAVEARTQAMAHLREPRQAKPQRELRTVTVETHLERTVMTRLGALARARGMSRSALIAEFVKAGLASKPNKRSAA
jgi:hypothetical protein